MTSTDPSPAIRAELISAWAGWFHRTRAQTCLDGGANDGGFDEYRDGWMEGRQTAYELGRLLAARCWSGELGIDNAVIDDLIRRNLAFLRRRQSPEGCLDLSGSYSPNEVGFTLPALVQGYRRISQLPGNPLADVAASLKEFLIRGAEAVLHGEAYTANHRWTASAAPLAAVHSLWPDARYLKKIETYLADGFDLNEDGCWYEERSPNYNNVANFGLLVLADCLGRPEWLDLIRRNLDFIAAFLQPNGEADCSFSHRQDRGAFHFRAFSYALARRIALHTGDGRYTAMAHHAWKMGDRGLNDLTPLLFELDRDDRALPAEKPLPTHFERNFTASRLFRWRHDSTALTLAADQGNHFYDSILQKWGGPRLSDDWFHLFHGEIVLQTLHLAGASMSNIQPQTLTQTGPGHCRLEGACAGWTHTAHFRPGSPPLAMTWDWKHEVDASIQEGAIDLSLRSTAGRSLIASFIFWFRPGVEIWEGERALGTLAAGHKEPLRGGAPLVLKKGSSEMKITGLPAATHHRFIKHAPSIPSNISTQCGALFLGLTFPVALDCRIELNSRP